MHDDDVVGRRLRGAAHIKVVSPEHWAEVCAGSLKRRDVTPISRARRWCQKARSTATRPRALTPTPTPITAPHLISPYVQAFDTLGSHPARSTSILIAKALSTPSHPTQTSPASVSFRTLLWQVYKKRLPVSLEAGQGGTLEGLPPHIPSAR